MVLQYFPYENLALRAPAVNNSALMQKGDLETNPENIQSNTSKPEQLSKLGPTISPKSLKIRFRSPRMSFVLLHGPQGWPQDAKMVPKDAKVKAPGLPNDKFRAHTITTDSYP